MGILLENQIKLHSLSKTNAIQPVGNLVKIIQIYIYIYIYNITCMVKSWTKNKWII